MHHLKNGSFINTHEKNIFKYLEMVGMQNCFVMEQNSKSYSNLISDPCYDLGRRINHRWLFAKAKTTGHLELPTRGFSEPVKSKIFSFPIRK